MPVDHYENFPVASWLLPRHLHDPVGAIYAFARSADDLADEGDLSTAERQQALDGYRIELTKIATGVPSDLPIFRRLAAVIAAHELPLQPFLDLLDAFSQDVVTTRYANFAELMAYCRRSADPVGRLMLRLYGAETPQHLVWSDNICSSLQLINHWQDVAVDWRKGRVYLPQDDLQRFGVGESQIAAAEINDNWRSLMRFQVERARAMMLAGSPLGQNLSGRIGMELRLVIAGGLRILEKLETVDFDMFRRRPRLRSTDWPLLIWRGLFAAPAALQQSSKPATRHPHSTGEHQ